MLLVARHAIVPGMTPPFRMPHVVLSVRDLREEVRAGLGQAALTVRTLDGVSLTVHAGELIVLRGGIASGAASLLNALAGISRPRTGERVPARGLRVRRGCISPAAFAAIAAAWDGSDASLDTQVGTTVSRPLGTRVGLAQTARLPLVYVFRVRPRADHLRTSSRRDVADPRAWRAWADALRAGGGSVLAHLPPACEPHEPWRYGSPRAHSGSIAGHNTSGDQLRASRSTAVHETAIGTRSARVPSSGYTGGVRTITLAAGRIVSADPVRRPTWSEGSADF